MSFHATVGGASRAIQDRERVLENPTQLGSKEGLFQEGLLSCPPTAWCLLAPPTAASSDHLLVFPGTFPNPGTCPHPACLNPHFCRPLHRAADWPDLHPSATATGKGGHRRRVPSPLGSTAGWARDGWGGRRVPVGGRVAGLGASGRKGCWLACLVSTLLPSSSCVFLRPTYMPDCFSAALWDACRLVATPCPQCWPGPTGHWPLWLQELSQDF